MKALVLPALAALNFVAFGAANAQMDHSMHGAAMVKPAAATSAAPKADATAMGEGEVKKVNKARGTVTLAHGALPNGMPPMTMAYKVKDASWLDQLQAGQKIRFATDPLDGGMTVTRFEPVKPAN
ncbi:copper-binding protein [Rhodoferax sp.]|uniref:copper-binding protein n=1 Tax=Rhodoferax sp. TaxID=50421 RepID=UPI0026168DE2|nr:copper-binding protein [Rhodoferax sp.]MDD2810534.1 copper-binding protein [Rhodoferax sp.]MDD4943909.1 copper-binding protein [Rhodoferax sp.]